MKPASSEPEYSTLNFSFMELSGAGAALLLLEPKTAARSSNPCVHY
jgi:hypothetical protein